MGVVSQSVPETANDGEVDEAVLTSYLRRIFEAGRRELELMGRLALGRALDGEDYNWLPSHSPEGGFPLVEDNPGKVNTQEETKMTAANNTQSRGSSLAARW